MRASAFCRIISNYSRYVSKFWPARSKYKDFTMSWEMLSIASGANSSRKMRKICAAPSALRTASVLTDMQTLRAICHMQEEVRRTLLGIHRRDLIPQCEFFLVICIRGRLPIKCTHMHHVGRARHAPRERKQVQTIEFCQMGGIPEKERGNKNPRKTKKLSDERPTRKPPKSRFPKTPPKAEPLLMLKSRRPIRRPYFPSLFPQKKRTNSKKDSPKKQSSSQ